MERNLGQEQEIRSMNNEEIQPGITMETASPWISYCIPEKGLHGVIKRALTLVHTHVVHLKS